MQPIGLLVWIYQAQFKKEQQEFVARKLDTVGWTKYLSFSILWWLTLVSFTNPLTPIVHSVILLPMTNGVGQLLMTAVYREQWIFSGLPLMFLYLPLVGRKPSNSKENTSFTLSTVSLVGTNGVRQLRKLSTYVYQLIRGSSRVLF